MRLFLKSSVAFCAMTLLSVAGCGDGSSLNTVPATGSVTLDGEPVEGAVVTFSPEGEGHAAGGVTDATGAFVLTTEVKGDGAVPGTYNVMISKFEKKAEPMGPPTDDIDAAYAAAEAAGINTTGPPKRTSTGPKNLLPKKYQSPATSGLTATVAEEGENTFMFELEE